MTIAGAISSLATGTYTVTRETPGASDAFLADYSRGKAVAGTTSTLTITAAIYPAKARDLLRLEEGRRSEAAIVIFTATELRTAVAPNGGNADRIAYGPDAYEVQAVDPWPGGFWKAIALMVQP